ncbi:MAG: hypothetical protein KatS3mg131_3746 [Candidatus Tectimicrobiota bacterium]|nr:MAG: hypothetical protein KatS3mg131_3746 [Candidatus Tectomicrobia bacterium]
MHRAGFLMAVCGFVSLSLATSLWAVAVGELNVHSRRGEPLVATVPLGLHPYERELDIAATLGTAEEYAAEGLQRPAFVDRLRLSLVLGPPDFIRLTSEEAIQVPSFDLVLLVRAGQVTIVKSYRVALPPPPAPPAASPVARAALSPAPPPAARQEAALPPPAWVQRLPARYGPVKRGETLYGIVRALGVPEEAVWQAVVLIWQANRERFAAGNMHGLLVGTFLTVPPHLDKEVAKLSRAEAQRLVAEQWEAWQERQYTTRPEPPTTPVRSEPEKAEVAAPSPSPQTVVLSTEDSPETVSVTELRTVLQGLETGRLPPLPSHPAAERSLGFVSTAELQAALQRLEERLTRQWQQLLHDRSPGQLRSTSAQGSVSLSPPLAPAPSEERAWQRLLLATPYVLVVENALILLCAVILLWRWVRRPR